MHPWHISPFTFLWISSSLLACYIFLFIHIQTFYIACWRVTFSSLFFFKHSIACWHVKGQSWNIRIRAEQCTYVLNDHLSYANCANYIKTQSDVVKKVFLSLSVEGYYKRWHCNDIHDKIPVDVIESENHDIHDIIFKDTCWRS